MAEEVIVLMRKTSRKYCCPRFGCSYRRQNRRARRTEERVLREPDDDRHAFRHQGPSCHLYHSTARFFALPRACFVCSLTDFRAFSDRPRSSAAVSYVLSDMPSNAPHDWRRADRQPRFAYLRPTRSTNRDPCLTSLRLLQVQIGGRARRH